MPRATASSFLTVAATILSLSACGYDCGTRGGTVANGGVLDASGVVVATASATLIENVGPSFMQFMVSVGTPIEAAGEPLRGHVTRARLVSEAGESLAELSTSVAPMSPNGVVSHSIELSSRADYDRLRRELLTARTRIVLDTDLPGREHIEATLSDAHGVPGNVQRCQPLRPT